MCISLHDIKLSIQLILLTVKLLKITQFAYFHLQSIMMWLPKAEEKFSVMQPVAADPRAIRIQIEELKVFLCYIEIVPF